MIIEFFPEEFIQLNKEVEYHPVLVEYLAKHPPNEYEIRMAEISAYCGVILDGSYTYDEMKKLADILTKKLKEARVIDVYTPQIIIPS